MRSTIAIRRKGERIVHAARRNRGRAAYHDTS